MKCHNHEDDNKNTENEKKVNHKGHNHGLLMIVLCLIPMGIVLIVPLLSNTINTQSNPLIYLFVLLCPLMHILMMFSMRKNHDNKE